MTTQEVMNYLETSLKPQIATLTEAINLALQSSSTVVANSSGAMAILSSALSSTAGNVVLENGVVVPNLKKMLDEVQAVSGSIQAESAQAIAELKEQSRTLIAQMSDAAQGINDNIESGVSSSTYSSEKIQALLSELKRTLESAIATAKDSLLETQTTQGEKITALEVAKQDHAGKIEALENAKSEQAEKIALLEAGKESHALKLEALENTAVKPTSAGEAGQVLISQGAGLAPQWGKLGFDETLVVAPNDIQSQRYTLEATAPKTITIMPAQAGVSLRLPALSSLPPARYFNIENRSDFWLMVEDSQGERIAYLAPREIVRFTKENQSWEHRGFLLGVYHEALFPYIPRFNKITALKLDENRLLVGTYADGGDTNAAHLFIFDKRKGTIQLLFLGNGRHLSLEKFGSQTIAILTQAYSSEYRGYGVRAFFTNTTGEAPTITASQSLGYGNHTNVIKKLDERSGVAYAEHSDTAIYFEVQENRLDYRAVKGRNLIYVSDRFPNSNFFVGFQDKIYKFEGLNHYVVNTSTTAISGFARDEDLYFVTHDGSQGGRIEPSGRIASTFNCVITIQGLKKNLQRIGNYFIQYYNAVNDTTRFIIYEKHGAGLRYKRDYTLEARINHHFYHGGKLYYAGNSLLFSLDSALHMESHPIEGYSYEIFNEKTIAYGGYGTVFSYDFARGYSKRAPYDYVPFVSYGNDEILTLSPQGDGAKIKLLKAIA